MKFAEFSEQDRVQLIKDEFWRLLEVFSAEEDANIKKVIGDVAIENFKNALNSIRKVGCICSSCVEPSKLSSFIPPEFSGLLDLARSNCETRAY